MFGVATPPEDKQAPLLEAALLTFARFGYKKTSMEEVARAAGLSRQGLYLRFPNKEALFRAAVGHLFETSLAKAEAALKGQGALEARLVAAFDRWHGDTVELLAASPHLDELIAAGARILGPLEEEARERFLELLAGALGKAGGKKRLAAAGVTPRQVAVMLNATSTGLKHGGHDRAAHREGVRTAVRMVVAQLAAGKE